MAYPGQNQNYFNTTNSSPLQNNQFSGTYSPTQMQPLFPQPTGSVYNINNTLEVANVPAGIGMSVALCLPENIMYIKTMQNGTPMFWAYKITPYDNKNNGESQEGESAEKNDFNVNKDILKEMEAYKNKVEALEKQIALIKKEIGGI